MLYQIDPIAWMMAGEHRHLLLNEPSGSRLPYHLRPARATGPSLIARSLGRARAALATILAGDDPVDIACCAA